ncbi:MAG: hypothetical protein ABIE74_06515 [Pseudomonadota bacterium]
MGWMKGGGREPIQQILTSRRKKEVFMKKLWLLTLMAICLGVGGYFLNIDVANNAIAETADTNIIVGCEGAIPVAFAPVSVTYALTISPPAILQIPLCSVTGPVVVGTPVESEGGVDSTECYFDGVDMIKASSEMPYLKLAGLLCTTYDSAALKGSGANATDLVVNAQDNISSDATVFAQIDSVAGSQLFGELAVGAPADGLIRAFNLADGSDGDSLFNGEIFFGGYAENGDNGGFYLGLELNAYNLVVDGLTEAITWTFTAIDAIP